jgi:flagellin
MEVIRDSLSLLRDRIRVQGLVKERIVQISSMSNAQQALQLAANQLSSGRRITSAGVDPSGLAIASALTSQANGFDQGASNAQTAINASYVAQAATATISDAAQRLQTLSVAANNDLLSAGDRANLQTEANQNTQEINSIASTTQFNGVHLLDGSTPSANIQTGAGQGSTAALSLPSSGSNALGLSNVDLSSSASSTTSEYSADAAISAISSGQATLGSQTVALQFDQRNSELASNNLTASASNITDADITKTATEAANKKAAMQVQAALQLQSNLAATSLLGLFPR